MAGSKEKQRFLFFKYVPPKKNVKPIKEEQYKKVETGNNTQEEMYKPPVVNPDFSYNEPCPEEPNCGECPEEPTYGEYPEEPNYGECPEEPSYGECPEEPDYGECPEVPDYGECPDIPECPELPDIPECPGEEEPVEEGPCPENSVMHVIKAGDTFWKLANLYETSVEAIANANPDVDPLNLQIGDTLCIPLGVPGARG